MGTELPCLSKRNCAASVHDCLQELCDALGHVCLQVPTPAVPVRVCRCTVWPTNFFLFRFVLKQICLFLLFWCSKHSKKPKKLFYGFTKQTKIPDNSNRLSFSSFRFKLKIFSLCFEDTLITTQGPSAEYSEACIEDVDLPLLKKIRLWCKEGLLHTSCCLSLVL
jgi:hypothetical protein